MNKQIDEVLEYLFSAKKLIENSKNKSDQHTLGCINEAIKRQQYQKRL